MQTCRTCGESKPLEEFDLRADTGKRRTQCKACRRVYQTSPVDPSRTRTKWLVGTDALLVCRKCGMAKPWTEFPRRGRNSHRLQTWCKLCVAAYQAKHHRDNHEREMRRIRRNQTRRVAEHRARLREYLLSHPCVDCGESDPAVLEFDHVRDVKVDDVTALVTGGYSWARIELEIAKCEVRCGNCHRRVTNARRHATTGVSEDAAIYDFSDPGAIRTRGQHLRRVLLYPLSYGVLGVDYLATVNPHAQSSPCGSLP
jgi:hypothetical protein